MWYYYVNNQQFGPVNEDEIIRLIQNGAIGRDTFLWTEGFTDWMLAGQTKFTNLLVNEHATTMVHPGSYSYPIIRFQPHSLRTLWLWLAWLVGLGFPLSFVCIGLPAVIAGTVLGYILLYRSWLLFYPVFQLILELCGLCRSFQGHECLLRAATNYHSCYQRGYDTDILYT